MKRYITTLLLLFVSTLTFAQVDSTLIDSTRVEVVMYDSIENDPRYIALCEEHSSLLESEDSFRVMIAEARDNYLHSKGEVNATEEVEGYATQILNLEKEIFKVRTNRRRVVDDIAVLEQQYLVRDIKGGGESVYEDDYRSVKGDNTEHSRLILNSVIARSLSSGSYADLKKAQREDELMSRVVDDYIATYARLTRTVRAYNIATEEREGEEIYGNYLDLRDRADSLGGIIDKYWNNILNTKYYAYGYILEHYGLYDLLDNSSADFSAMQQRCANEDGRYALDALAHYAIGRPTLVAFERDFAREMGLNLAADSLQSVYEEIMAPEYRIQPVTLERRLFVEYESLSFGGTNYYNDSNPIPQVKVYERGVIYRVLLGVFRNKQPMSVMKGARPLYITKDDSGYSYYVGGFETEDMASAAVEELLAKGFKEPQICCWRDGKMTNISLSEEDEAEVATLQPTGQRYIVLLDCGEISESMRNTISMTAPEKRISRRGAGFAIGTFTSRGDAESLKTAISENHPKIKVSIVELNIQ
ncbi:MAG: hypothetical protein IKJ08_01895 [Alistipes sp.]|nr:hypothetical protein [Alistipes sp.]